MSYIGIGYNGPIKGFLQDLAGRNMPWLKADRVPRFFGDAFVVLYDSNTAREFAKRARDSAEPNTIVIYPMERPLEEG